MILAYRYRLKDGRASDRAALRAQARAVNFVWNYCCEIQRTAESRWKAGGHGNWPTYFDLTYLTAGACRDMGLLADTINAVCRIFAQARDANRGCPRWRSAKKSLDWIPVNNAWDYLRFKPGGIRFRKHIYRLWVSRELPSDAVIRTASFGCDARGRWYVNLHIKTDEVREHGVGEVGIDLGLRTLAMLSTGDAIPNLRHRDRYAEALAVAQRARSKHRVRAIHAKIANSRRDHLHKVSTAIMRANRRVIVGNVSASKLVKTRMAKSVLGAGWSSFRSMLAYKAARHQVEYAEVNEAWTSRTCSACGCIPASSPKGMGALGMRRWVCSECGVDHDRDRNAALNILRVGAERCPPVEGIAA